MTWLFAGRQDNVALRFGGGVGLLFNVVMMVIAIAAIIVTSEPLGIGKTTAGPGERRDVAPPALGN